MVFITRSVKDCNARPGRPSASVYFAGKWDQPAFTSRDSRISMCSVDAIGMLRKDCFADFPERSLVVIDHRLLREQRLHCCTRFAAHGRGNPAVREDRQLVDEGL